jgi:hypothetical protein
MLKIPVSLGFLCDSRTHIKNQYNLSKDNGYKTCPFDIMMSNYKGVIDCFKDDFEGFCDPKYIELKNIHGSGESWIYNNKYRFLFNHESPGHTRDTTSRSNLNHYIDNNYENFITRYRQRISNFRNYLNSGIHIIFVLFRYNNNSNDLTELNDIIRVKYPNLSFEFDLLQYAPFFNTRALQVERLYSHELMMGINDDDTYTEHKRFHYTHTFADLHKDYNFTIFKHFHDDNLILNEHDLKSKFLAMYLFKHAENLNMVYSLKSFYKNYPSFNYYLFRKLHSNELDNFTEEETIIYWYNNYYKVNKDAGLQSCCTDGFKFYKDVIIYLHQSFNLKDGGATVQYYLANILDRLGVRVRCNVTGMNDERNIIFNNKYTDDFNVDESIVIYCEGVHGNPLQAKNVVRWMLSPLGTNVPYNMIDQWNKNELVYYFNPEKRFEKSLIGITYKMLTCPYINPNIINYNRTVRSGSCFHYRKTHFYKNGQTTKLHNEPAFEIYFGHTSEDHIHIFNNYKYFFLYDPLCFLMTISAMCGCVAIVHPIEGLTKLEWLHTTFYSFYLTVNNLNNIYGIAYGIEDIEYATNTVHLAYDQTHDINKCFIDLSIKPFLNDINNFEQMTNTLKNNYNL